MNERIPVVVVGRMAVLSFMAEAICTGSSSLLPAECREAEPRWDFGLVAPHPIDRDLDFFIEPQEDRRGKPHQYHQQRGPETPPGREARARARAKRKRR